MSSAIYQPDATGLIAVTIEGACHIPFGRRIEKSKLFTGFNVSERSYFHLCGIEETIGITSMIDILQKIRMQMY